MEPTTKGGGSKWIIWVVVIVVILLIVMFASKRKTEAPVDTDTRNLSGASMENSQLDAEVSGAMDFDNESSMKEIDKEYQ